MNEREERSNSGRLSSEGIPARERVHLVSSDEPHELSLSEISPHDLAVGKVVLYHIRSLEHQVEEYRIIRTEFNDLRVKYAALEERVRHNTPRDIALLVIGVVLGMMQAIYSGLGVWAAVIAGVICCLLAIPVVKEFFYEK